MRPVLASQLDLALLDELLILLFLVATPTQKETSNHRFLTSTLLILIFYAVFQPFYASQRRHVCLSHIFYTPSKHTSNNNFCQLNSLFLYMLCNPHTSHNSFALYKTVLPSLIQILDYLSL